MQVWGEVTQSAEYCWSDISMLVLRALLPFLVKEMQVHVRRIGDSVTRMSMYWSCPPGETRCKSALSCPRLVVECILLPVRSAALSHYKIVSPGVEVFTAHSRVVAEGIKRLVASMGGDKACFIWSMLPLLTRGALALGRKHKLAANGKPHRAVANN
eukprot:5784240-Amphidinium_carterae.1